MLEHRASGLLEVREHCAITWRCQKLKRNSRSQYGISVDGWLTGRVATRHNAKVRIWLHIRNEERQTKL